ncbi:quinone oxidoreductase family protein [Oryzicola mucosus]|uniref:quinone oxidoreductase family protein n=1 Tax=Oryzicola mucosus TaxID=2767425 RepID=UPI001AEDAC2E
MKALVADHLNGLDGLRLGDVATPALPAGEILVRMRFAGINPADWKTAEGYLKVIPHFRPHFPFVIGLEGAGTVATVGEGVTDFAPGDHVVLKSDVSQGRWGTFAECIAIEPRLAARLPRGLPLDAAASLPIAGLTAWHSLMLHGAMKPNETVFIHAGAGGVGSFAVQIAARAGAKVLASCSPANAEYLRARGAYKTFDYRDPDMATKIRAAGTCDVVVDAINDGQHGLIGCLASGGRYVTIPTLDPRAVRPDARKLAAVGATFVPGGLVRERTREGLETLIALYIDGLTLPELQVLPTDDFVEALSDCRSGTRRGKAVVRLWGEDKLAIASHGKALQ